MPDDNNEHNIRSDAEHRDGLLNHTSSTRITGVEIKNSSKLIGGRKHLPICIPILCYAPPCPCMGGPIVWLPAEAILSQRPTATRTAEGHPLVEFSITKGTAAIVEKPLRMNIDTISAAQNLPKPCGDRTVYKGISLSDLLGGPHKAAKAAFAAGFAFGTWADGKLDGGLSDQGADYIESVADFFGDLFD